MTRSGRNGLIAVLIVVGAVAAIIGMCWASEPLGLRGSHKDWFVHTEAATLIQFTDRIIIARYLGETVYAAHNSPTPYAKSPIAFVDAFRGFDVVESLKGDFEPGDTTYVRWSEGYYRRDANGDPEFIERPAVPLTPGETYVLFLNRYPGRRPPDLGVGIRVWRTAEGLVAARIDSNGRLSFTTSTYYQAALKDMGLKPLSDSGVPFELTMEEIRRLVASPPPGNQ